MAIRTHYLDASALIKLLVQESNSTAIRAYFDSHSVFYVASICLAEALGVLKRKFLRNELSQDEYLAASAELMGHLRGETLAVDDLPIAALAVYDEVEMIAVRHQLDIADAFQLVVLMRGELMNMEGDSAPWLITADAHLANAARQESLKVWDCIREPAP